MIERDQSKAIDLILNEPTNHHFDSLRSLLESAKRFQCMTAFARKTGLDMIRKDLKRYLNSGSRARFVVGLNFYQTDPSVLEDLLKYGELYKLELLVSRPPWN